MILKLKQTPGIYLVGFMGCGKSKVGSALADELGWSFYDSTRKSRRPPARTIAELFDPQGEAAFRDTGDGRTEETSLQRAHRAGRR